MSDYDPLGVGVPLAYCTNVHAGATLEQTLANLEKHACAVRRIVCPDKTMGVGLWLSAEAAQQVVTENRTTELRAWLAERDLTVRTMNGFPYGNFHEAVVKHAVYEPDWADPRRLEYTKHLITILAALLPANGEGSISTLPIGWRPSFAMSMVRQRGAAEQLLDLVHFLARVELDTGRYIHIDLEPEPGCLLDTAADVIGFFERYLLKNPDEVSVRAYLRVCHDICHSAVMFEPQEEVIRAYTRAGLGVGKVQVSSAVRVAFDELPEAHRAQAMEQLRAFDEPRYLHQTCVRGKPTSKPVFHEDLSAALAGVSGEVGGEWRVHFHVPLFLEQFGQLGTTQEQILPAVRAAIAAGTKHFEVETYAWSVLPPELRTGELAEGIAREMTWLAGVMNAPVNRPTRPRPAR
ncbi:MAG: metabolite traffic protein EboE [Planctomycetes bacterium]|nr:metabolite traffic protein EboE [Planctomycetota bacterium]